MTDKLNRAKGALLGLALGDALGTTLEFKRKDSYEHITDMLGGGPFRLEAGQWTDDTSMMICLAKSLFKQGENDLFDQMQSYNRWYREGENSVTGRCFDIGNTVSESLNKFTKTQDPLAGSENEFSAGNGSLMRIAPIALFCHKEPIKQALKEAALSSRTTHGEQRCVEACQLMTFYIHTLLNTEVQMTKEALLFPTNAFWKKFVSELSDDIHKIALGDYRHKTRDEIKGTGFVVHSLEAALWCFYHSNSFEEGALLAANLGDDADTTAAIYGQLAGAFYGASELPQSWLKKLAWGREIDEMAKQLINLASPLEVAIFIDANKILLNENQAEIIKKSGEFTYGDCNESATFRSTCYELNMMQPCDYHAFMDSVPYKLNERKEWLKTATRSDCLIFLTALVRAEHMGGPGEILNAILNGLVFSLMTRLNDFADFKGLGKIQKKKSSTVI